MPDAALIRVLATSFCFDVRWFLQLLPRGIPTTIIKHARDPCQLSGSERSSSSASGPLPEHPLPDWADLCVIRPFLKGSANKPNNSGCMHPKLLLLWFVDRLRVVIGSANLHPAEWLSIGQVDFCFLSFFLLFVLYVYVRVVPPEDIIYIYDLYISYNLHFC